ncbi:MAG: adenylate/guanylate cyclase domain-containing protein [Desulfobacula sp.]|nr:adenylate/guanylate cyclase domain-containing protein [Desulfobacula sp.]
MKPNFHIRISIFIKLLAFSCLLVIVITSSIGFFVLNVQKNQFKRQLTDYGKSLLHIMAKNAPDKLLAEEDLSLFKLVKDISENEQIVKVSITNQKNIIIAHSDIEQINKPYTPPQNLENGLQQSQLHGQEKGQEQGLTLSTFFFDGKEFLYFETPLTYQKVKIGNAQIVISQRIIEESIAQSKQYILVSFVIIIILSLLSSLGFSIYFSRPIKKLEKSVAQFGAGNFTHRTPVTRNDEMGDLANAFNQMAQDIELKEKIKDSFGRYVAPEIVEMILSNPLDHWMKASSKQATVLFTDIRGFTSLSENKHPEDIVDMLNEHFTQITETIIRHGGHIDKFVGDAAMAVFGITKETSDHAEYAVNAAVEIMNKIESQAAEKSDKKNSLRISIGINTGFMVAGNLGSKKKMEYTVIGDNVNIASRLTSMADPGEILISGKTFDSLKDESVKVEEKGQMTIKGKTKKIRVFTLTNAGDERSCSEGKYK